MSAGKIQRFIMVDFTGIGEVAIRNVYPPDIQHVHGKVFPYGLRWEMEAVHPSPGATGRRESMEMTQEGRWT